MSDIYKITDLKEFDQLWRMLSKKPKIINVGKDVEILEPLRIIGRIVKYSSYCGRQYGDSSNFGYLFFFKKSRVSYY